MIFARLTALAAFAGVCLGARAADLAPAPTHVPTSLFKLSDPDLEVTVWATSPSLKNPTNMDTDQFGRIWVAEGVNYRSPATRQPAGDRIMVLEDTDGDGKADKSWTFVQEPFLLAPMGICVIDNKVIVSMTPDLIVYTDVNRNAKFDPAGAPDARGQHRWVCSTVGAFHRLRSSAPPAREPVRSPFHSQ